MPDTTPNPNRMSKTKLFLVIFFSSIVALVITGLALFGAGQTSGVEFSPDDFSRRQFTYNQTPFFKWVIIGKTYTDATTTMDSSLVTGGFIKPIRNKTKVWHLISDSGTNSEFYLPSHKCDARFLTDYIDLYNEDGDEIWTLWNQDFPNSAKLFWPRIAELARDEMYLRIPDVMRTAMAIEKDEPDKFEKQLDKVIADVYRELGKLDFEMQRFERAKFRLEKAAKLEPTDEVVEMLEKCRKLAPDSVLAEAPESPENVEPSEPAGQPKSSGVSNKGEKEEGDKNEDDQ